MWYNEFKKIGIDVRQFARVFRRVYHPNMKRTRVDEISYDHDLVTVYYRREKYGYYKFCFDYDYIVDTMRFFDSMEINDRTHITNKKGGQMEIKNGVPPAILTAAVAVLQPYVPELSPKSLVAALKNYSPEGRFSAREDVPEKPFTRAEVCELLGISLPTLTRYIKSGHLRKISLSTHTVRIDPASVRNLIEKSGK